MNKVEIIKNDAYFFASEILEDVRIAFMGDPRSIEKIRGIVSSPEFLQNRTDRMVDLLIKRGDNSGGLRDDALVFILSKMLPEFAKDMIPVAHDPTRRLDDIARVRFTNKPKVYEKFKESITSEKFKNDFKEAVNGLKTNFYESEEKLRRVLQVFTLAESLKPYSNPPKF
jgi:hypothetical protein